MRKKRAVTLMEMMVVIVLIGIIGTAIGYNMKGSLDKGRAFTTRQELDKIQSIVELEIEQRGMPAGDPAAIANTLKEYVTDTGLLKKNELKDAWGGDIVFEADGETWKPTSARLQAYEAAHGGPPR